MATLSKKHTCLLFKNRGTGCSTSGDRSFSISRFTDDTAGLMGRLGTARANVLRVSLGGMIAQEPALRHPDEV